MFRPLVFRVVGAGGGLEKIKCRHSGQTPTNQLMAVRLAGGLSAAEEVTEEIKALACSFQSAIEQERKVEYDAFMPLSYCSQVG